MEHSIQKANLSHAEAYWRISVETFAEAYADRNKPEDIEFYNATYFNLANIKSELMDTSVRIFVSENEREMTGYVKLKAHVEGSDFIAENALEIKRIYTRKAYYGTGLGKEILEKAVEFALQQGYSALVLAVWKENERAISFYKKHGFKIAGETTFDWGTGKIDEDWWMVKQLVPGH